MTVTGKSSVSNRVVLYEILAFTLIILLLWLDEVIDIPFLFLGGEATPVNWRESLFETLGIMIIAVIIINHTNRIFKKMKYLEGLFSVCASCKRIKDEKGNWQQIETYIRERSEAEFSHGICPECAEKLYPEFMIKNKEHRKSNDRPDR